MQHISRLSTEHRRWREITEEAPRDLQSVATQNETTPYGPLFGACFKRAPVAVSPRIVARAT